MAQHPDTDAVDATSGPADEAKPSGRRNSRHGSTAVRRALLDAAAGLFAARGYGGTNLRDVADALGMSRTGLYHHFPSKEKLLEAIVEEVTFSSERQLDEIITKGAHDFEAVLRVLVYTTTLWILDHHVMFRVLDRSEADLPQELRERNDKAKRAILSRYVAVIEGGIEQGRFRPVDAHVAALSLSGMRNWVAWWYRDDGRLSKAQIAEQLSEMAMQSLLRMDAHRSRSDRMTDALRVLEEDVAHLKRLIGTQS